MKAIVLIIFALLVFLGCAYVGFQAAEQLSPLPSASQTPDPGVVFRGDQHNFLLIRVDQLDTSQPKLVSIWFVSLFFLDDNPTVLTLAQIYPSSAASSTFLEKAFSFTPQGEIPEAFWSAVRAYGFVWESYIVIDAAGSNEFLQWLAGSGDFSGDLEAASFSQEDRLRIVEQTCKFISESSGRDLGEINWSNLMPVHFRSDMRLEAGLGYWDRLSDSGPVRCEILPAP